ncbi:unnamed protein product, partial [Brassica oleracea var. botrytis]
GSQILHRLTASLAHLLSISRIKRASSRNTCTMKIRCDVAVKTAYRRLIWKGNEYQLIFLIKLSIFIEIEGRGLVKFVAHLKDDEFEFIDP